MHSHSPDDPDGPLQTYHFRVVLFGSPFMLYIYSPSHLTQNNSVTSTDIFQNLYMYVSGCSTEEGSLTYYTKAM